MLIHLTRLPFSLWFTHTGEGSHMSQTEVATADKGKSRKAPPAAWVFFKRWLADPLTMGSIVPSSIGLRRLVSKNLICGPDQIVVEFGGGTGAITKAVLEAGIPADRVYTIEIDPELAKFLHLTYPDAKVIHGDCRHVDELIGKEWVGKVGTIIVGIPMVMLPIELQKEIIEAIFRVLQPGGRFLLYTYCATSPLAMRKLGLKGKRLGWTPQNFPPASVWGYSKA
ncbi:phosphatidylethanolamine/phosphatidyl-N-methylethanolamine N-methyltransferase [Azospirillaceae bacterium]